jgi:hypothetical protein
MEEEDTHIENENISISEDNHEMKIVEMSQNQEESEEKIVMISLNGTRPSL